MYTCCFSIYITKNIHFKKVLIPLCTTVWFGWIFKLIKEFFAQISKIKSISNELNMLIKLNFLKKDPLYSIHATVPRSISNNSLGGFFRGCITISTTTVYKTTSCVRALKKGYHHYYCSYDFRKRPWRTFVEAGGRRRRRLQEYYRVRYLFVKRLFKKRISAKYTMTT